MKEDGMWDAVKVIDVPAKKVSKDGVESELNGRYFFSFFLLFESKMINCCFNFFCRFDI